MFLLFAPLFGAFAAGSGHIAETEPVLDLQRVIKLALDTNRSLIGGQYGVDSRRLSLGSAQSEFEWKFAPGADANVDDAGRQFSAGVVIEKKFASGLVASLNPRLTLNHYDGEDDDVDGEVNLKLILPLLRGFGSHVNLHGIHTAAYSLRSARRLQDLAKVNIVLSTVRAVYDIVQQKELVALYQGQVDRFKRHAVLAHSREKVGLASPIDTYRAEIRLKDAQDSLSRSQEALHNAGDNLKLILASPLEHNLRVTAPLAFKSVDITIGEAVAAAMRHRIELKQAADEIEEARRAARIFENNLKPQLDLMASYRQMGSDGPMDDTLQFDEERWTVNLVSSTDWSRKVEKAAYRQSLLAIRMASLNRSSKIDSIRQEVRRAYDALQKSEERISLRDVQIGQASGKLALANVQFCHGMADNFDVIEAETELQTAKVNWLAAKIEHIVGRYQLRAAMGTLIQ